MDTAALARSLGLAMAPGAGTPVTVRLAETGPSFIVSADPMEAERIRSIPGTRYNRVLDEWTMPATRVQAALLSHYYGGRLEPSQEVSKHVDLLFADREIKYKTFINLFPFQEQSLERMLKAGSVLNGSEMGTGKTPVAIAWMANLAPRGKHLVVCPNGLKYNWKHELATWWPEVPVTVVHGSADQRRKQLESYEGGVMVINYESLRIHSRLAPWGGKSLTDKQKQLRELNGIGWDTVVVDEAHKIKNPGAQQTMAVKQMGLESRYRLAMTGTPVLDTPDDLWSILNFLHPEAWGSRNQFRTSYCDMVEDWHAGWVNQGIRQDRLEPFDAAFQPRFVRYTKTEVLPQLPEKFPIQYRRIPMAAKQKAAYNALKKDMLASVDGNVIAANNPVALLTRLHMIASASPVVNEDGELTHLDTPSNKVAECLEILDEMGGRPVVFYTLSRKLAILLNEEIEKAGYRSGLVHGDIHAEARADVVDRFQEGSLNAFVGTLGAAAEGITLHRADTIVLAQQSWSHAQNAQAIDRIHRIGQTRGVQPIVLVSENTIDEAVRATDKRKETTLQEIVRDPVLLKAVVSGEWPS